MKAKPLIFLKEVRREMERVAWPKRPEAVRLTLIVVGTSLAVGVFIGILDFVFTKLMSLIL